MASKVVSRQSKKLVERVSARVFCHNLDDDGGNPVTIFSSPHRLSHTTKQELAQSCEWESVIVHQNHHQNQQQQQRLPLVQNNRVQQKPQLSFYMPSGEQVSFCAHAAMGAALEICAQNDEERMDHDHKNSNNNNINQDDENENYDDDVFFTVANVPNDDDDNDNDTSNNNEEEQEYHTQMYEGDIVALHMSTTYRQCPVSQPSMLFRALREYCHVETQAVASVPLPSSSSNTKNRFFSKEQPGNSDYEKSYNYVTCHASIARPKTLVPLRSVELLHAARPPALSSAPGFAVTCKALDDTTGLYLFAKSQEEDGAWECRQFPRASGYPEDPATGIAAAALACHLRQELRIDLPAYKLYQGTAMGKPSLIVVDELIMTPRKEEDIMDASFRLLGRVEIDERSTIEVDDDDDDDDDVE